MEELLKWSTIVFSIISLLISLNTSKKQNEGNKKINDINLQSQIFMEIFKNYLVTEIPKSRNQLFIDKDGRLKDWELLSNVLSKLKHDALYFQYRDKFFYDKLMQRKEAIEVHLGENASKVLESKEKTDFMTKLDGLIDEFYKIVFSSYLNGN